MMQTLYYFGCRDRAGHYLFPPRGVEGPKGWDHRMEGLDGSLAPKIGVGRDARQAPNFQAQLWRLTGYTPLPYSALSWWDNTVDHRGGSSSTFFAPGHTVGAEGILRLAREMFPDVMARMGEIVVLPEVQEKTWAPRT